MKRLMMLTLAGLVLTAAAWGQSQDANKGKEATFKFDSKLTKEDSADRIRKGNPHRVHPCKLQAGVVYAITLTSKNPKEFDNYLRIEDSAGTNLAEDDDGAGWPNAQILFKPAKDDAHRIIVTAYEGMGEYTVTVKEVSAKELQGVMGVKFAESLRLQYEARYRSGDKKADSLLKEAEAVLGKLADPKLTGAAEELRFALEHLTVGRPAMDIEGEDLDGKKFKLSDYRGKVVVLDFWGNW